jgi:hypothetical protein
MRITKTHTLYVKDHKGALRNLYKTAPSVYLDVVTAFIEGDSKDKYAQLNQFAKVREDFKPVPVSLDPLYSAEFKKLLREVHGADSPRTSLVVSYNGSWQPLAEVSLEKVEDIKVDMAGTHPAESKETVIKQTLVAIISANRNTFNTWAEEKGLGLFVHRNNSYAYADDGAIKYTPIHDAEDTTGKRFDYYEVIEDWDGAAELIGIVETRLKKD